MLLLTLILATGVHITVSEESLRDDEFICRSIFDQPKEKVGEGKSKELEKQSSGPREKLPVSARPIYDESVKLVGLGDYETALRLLVKLADRESKNAWAQQFAADIAFLSGKFELAQQYCDRAIILDSKFANAWNIRAHSNLALGRAIEAELDFTKSLEIDQTDGAVWNNRAQCRRMLGKHADALKDITVARKFLFGPDVRLRHIVILYENMLFEEALGQAEKMCEIHASIADGHMFRAGMLIVLGRDKEAASAFDRAIELDPQLKEEIGPYRAEVLRFKAKANEKLSQAPAPRAKRP